MTLSLTFSSVFVYLLFTETTILKKIFLKNLAPNHSNHDLHTVGRKDYKKWISRFFVKKYLHYIGVFFIKNISQKKTGKEFF